VLHGGPDLPQTGRGNTYIFLDPLRISGMAEARDLKFYVLIEGDGP